MFFFCYINLSYHWISVTQWICSHIGMHLFPNWIDVYKITSQPKIFLYWKKKHGKTFHEQVCFVITEIDFLYLSLKNDKEKICSKLKNKIVFNSVSIGSFLYYFVVCNGKYRIIYNARKQEVKNKNNEEKKIYIWVSQYLTRNWTLWKKHALDYTLVCLFIINIINICHKKKKQNQPQTSNAYFMYGWMHENAVYIVHEKIVIYEKSWYMGLQ